ncbi:FAD/NAD(P)-binding domain-containing protein [Laetiporus sulphureus 93-53]|uniref:FAD/NAD(P)-binding domain-containing protein n=1 Tax=Laetiporus sulphureus 93-53 TaxID=1314785 RepID=A0A165EQV9_9APHY|nr:FAD/NAD(P)-binding domain-containing protein [Laetiporus sulphureus 93-53]KZT07570.1 FAD/NAD(P)-binding domain-containing protein [Laetiporus sulphureus 93-53]
MAGSSTDAPLNLDFLIVGGGVAGLSVAYVLAEAGHRVRLFEKRGVGIPAGGLRIPPNLSKILSRWVGPEELARTSVPCVGTPFRNLETGEDVGFLHWRPDVMRETGGDFLLMHHEDLHRMLHKLAKSAGVRIDCGTSVVAVHQGTGNSPSPSVSLSTGEQVTADIVIGADGPRSLVRNVVVGDADDAQPDFLTVYTTTIPGSEMRKDPELLKLLESDEWPIWMGSHRSVCAHPVRAKQDYAMHIYSHTGDSSCTGEDETWEEEVPVSSISFDDHAPIVKKLLGLAPFLLRTRLKKRSHEIEDWADETGRIVLIGEAAHPWQPGGTHGPSIAVEDAVVFGSLFCRLSTWEQVPSFLSAYQELRQNRCNEVKKSDLSNAVMVAMPPGPERDARDADMRKKNADEWDEGTMKRNFEEMAWVFGYVAQDDADEWWVNWGRLSDSVRGSFDVKHLSVALDMKTVESKA